MNPIKSLLAIYIVFFLAACGQKATPPPQYEDVVMDDAEYELDFIGPAGGNGQLMRKEQPGGRLAGEVRVTSDEGLISLDIQVGTKTDTKKIFHTGAPVRRAIFDEHLPPGELMFNVGRVDLAGRQHGTIRFHQKIVITPYKP